MLVKLRDVGDIVKCIECDAFVSDRVQHTVIGVSLLKLFFDDGILIHRLSADMFRCT